MNLNKLHLWWIIPTLLILVGCSAIPLPGGSASSTSTQPSEAAPAAQPLADKLAVGTLKLEGTAQAVTAEQAQTLLPLWKAVKSLSASDTASSDEIAALYTQIQEAMTAEQIKTITEMSIAPADMQALMQELGIQAPLGSPTRQANAQSQSSGGTRANGGAGNGAPGEPGAGGPPPDGGGGMAPDGGVPGAQTTPQAGQMARRPGGGMNTLFVAPLITLLEQKANA